MFSFSFQYVLLNFSGKGNSIDIVVKGHVPNLELAIYRRDVKDKKLESWHSHIPRYSLLYKGKTQVSLNMRKF